jgi:hypothetical protein
MSLDLTNKNQISNSGAEVDNSNIESTLITQKDN